MSRVPALPSTPIPVLYSDNDFCVVNKPHDLKMTGNTPEEISLATLLADQYPLPEAPGLSYRNIHQLDYATSGAVIFGKTTDAAAAGCALFASRRTRKEYLALLHGHITCVPNIPEVRPIARTELSSIIAHLKRESSVSQLGRITDDAPSVLKQAQEFFRDVQKEVEALLKSSSNTLTNESLLRELTALTWGQLTYKLRQKCTEKEMIKSYLRDIMASFSSEELSAIKSASSIDYRGLDSSNYLERIYVYCNHLQQEDSVRLRVDRRQFERKRKLELPSPSPSSEGSSSAVNPPPGVVEDEEGGEDILAFLDSHTLHTEDTTTHPQDVLFVVSAAIAEVSPFGDAFKMRLAPSPEEFAKTLQLDPYVDASGKCILSETQQNDLRGRPAQTVVEVLQRGFLRVSAANAVIPVTKVLFIPISGRRHQLRLHSLLIDYPIVGDATYTPDSARFQREQAKEFRHSPWSLVTRMCLHASRLELDWDALKHLPNRSNKNAKKWYLRAAGTALPQGAFEAPDPFVPGDFFGATLELFETPSQ